MKKREVKLSACEVVTNKNCDGSVSIPFEVGSKVDVEYMEHVGIVKYKSGATGDDKTYFRKAVKKITGKKLNGISCNDFIIDPRSKKVFCF